MSKTMFEVFHPIFGLNINSEKPVCVGNFTFYQFPRDKEIAMEPYIASLASRKITWWSSVFEETPVILGVKVDAITAKVAQERSELYFYRLTNLFEFLLFEHRKIFRVSVFDRNPIERNAYLIVSNNGEVHRTVSITGKRENIGLETLRQLNDDLFEKMANIITKPSKSLSNRERRVLLSIDFCGLAIQNIGKPSGFIHAVTAIEELLSVGKSGISQNISDNYAFIMGKDLANRKSLKRDIKRLYKIRSELAHGEKSTVNEVACIDAISRAKELILQFLFDDKLAKIQSNDEFLEYIENMKFADKREEI